MARVLLDGPDSRGSFDVLRDRLLVFVLRGKHSWTWALAEDNDLKLKDGQKSRASFFEAKIKNLNLCAPSTPPKTRTVDKHHRNIPWHGRIGNTTRYTSRYNTNIWIGMSQRTWNLVL